MRQMGEEGKPVLAVTEGAGKAGRSLVDLARADSAHYMA